jgi:hypothetical protein
MKKQNLLFVMLLAFLLTSCGNGVESLTQQNFGGSEYYVVQYDSDNTEADLKEYARTWNREDYTTYYFFFHKDSVDANSYSDYRFSKKRYFEKILEDNPQHGWYIMVNENKIYKDGKDIIEMAISDKYN